VAAFGANGILRCRCNLRRTAGRICVSTAVPATYYACTSTSASTAVLLASEVQNPVTLFAKDNNGVVINCPASQRRSGDGGGFP